MTSSSLHRLATSSVLVVVALGLARCGCYEDVAAYNQVVFSDDDSRLLIVELRYEERASVDPLMGTTEKQNFRHQLFTSAPDGSSPEPFGAVQTDQNGAEVYDMKTSGYVFVQAFDENGVSRMVRFDDEGSPTTLPEPDFVTPAFSLPSPDGAHIAQIAVDGRTADVRFLDATTLEPVGDDVSLAFTDNVDWTFRPDGVLVVTDRTTAQALSPGNVPVDTSMPGCLSPKTSSSPFSETGVVVFIAGESAIDTIDEGPESAFGCQ